MSKTDQVHFGSRGRKLARLVKDVKDVKDKSTDACIADLRVLKAKFDDVRRAANAVLAKDDADREYYDTKANIFDALIHEAEKEIFEPLFTEDHERKELARLIKKYGSPK